MVIADVGQKPLGRRLDHVEHHVEPAVAAVIGIRHVAPSQLGREIHQQVKPVLLAGGAKAGKVLVVFRIHGDHVIEPLEIPGLGLAGALAGKIEPPLAGRGPGAAVRRAAHVPASGAGRIHRHLAAEALPVHQGPEDALGGGGTANVPETDKQHLDQ